MMNQKRSDTLAIKLLASTSFIIIAAFMTYPGFFDRRTRGDEANLAVDIHRILRKGSVSDFLYENGQAFLAFVPTVLRVTGLSYEATNVLSPFIAALCLSSMVAFLYFIYRGESRDWLGSIPITAGFFSFAAFIGILSETSHKAIIYTIVYMCLYFVWRFYRGEYGDRQIFILIAALCSLSFFNVFWGMIYSGLFVLALIVECVLGRRIDDLSVGFILPVVSVVTIMTFLPTVSSAPVVFYVRIIRLFEPSTNPSTGATSADGLISGWQTMEVFGSEFSVWFLYTAGIFIIGILSVSAFFICVSRLMHKRTDSIDKILLIIFPPFGLIMIGMLVIGSLPAFRRLMVFPGIVGLLYWMTYISKNRDRISSPNVYTILTIATVIIICMSTFAAIPRLTPDGNNNPYDKFSDSSDFSRVSFALQGQSDCLISTEKHDTDIAKIVFGKIPSFEQQSSSMPPLISNKVYSSGTNDGLYCQS